MRPMKIKLSITLDEDVARRARELSEEDDRSLSQYINLALKEHIAMHDKRSEAEAQVSPPSSVC